MIYVHYNDCSKVDARFMVNSELGSAIDSCLTPSVCYYEQTDTDRLERKCELMHDFIMNIVVKLAEKGVLSIAEINEALPKGSISE